MDEAQRRHYLKAMGVQLWELRDQRKERIAGEDHAAELNHRGLAQVPPPSREDRWGRFNNQVAASISDRPHPSLPPLEEGNGKSGVVSSSIESIGKNQSSPFWEENLDSAAIAREWGALQEEVAACVGCPLHATRTHSVFGSGNPKAQWMVIGEAPGEQEDLQGKPFVGRAGQLLTEMLRAIGLDREKDVFITNVLKSRPPGNRDPKPEEVAACEPFLKRQIAWIKPKIILSVGRISAQNLLKTDTPIGKLRGQVHRYQGIPLVVTYHPAYLLRSPLEKRKAWDDLCLARRAFAATES